MKDIWYVYKTTNIVNGKIYVGKHHSNRHNATYLGSGKLLWIALKKYGRNNFIQEVLEYCDTEKEVFEREKYWIKQLNSQNRDIGYNLSDGGESGWNSEINALISQRTWQRYTPEERQARIDKMKAAAHRPESLKKISEKSIQFHQSMTDDEKQSFKEKCSKGWTSEKRERQRETHSGKKNSMYGRPLFEVWKEKYGEEEAQRRLLKWKLSLTNASNATKEKTIVKQRDTIERQQQSPFWKEYQAMKVVPQHIRWEYKKGIIDENERDKRLNEVNLSLQELHQKVLETTPEKI
jgi:group I intron endonuclease